VARLDYRPTFLGPELVGGIFRVGLRAAHEGSPVHRDERPRLPGLAGTSLSWVRTAGALRDALRAQRWVVLDGESGTGKFALARAMHYGEMPDRHFRMIDSTTAAEDPEAWLASVEDELAGTPGTLVLRHLDQLPNALIGPLSELLVEASARSRGTDGHWVVATRDHEADHSEVVAQLVPIFDVTITVEPLRHRGEDIRGMAPLMLSQIARSDEVLLSGRALNQLQRHPWPGNAKQLQEVLRKVLASKRRGVVELNDLPAECMAVSRRTLSPLESMERDAVIRSLQNHGGNKSLAAVDLGMSRATIYRKIREYSITTDS
jgi:sigma-54 dependent transcriptional regulator, acetoin dehydrogenase operon transcriptional activator AcoR